jgi:hypothetical protein
VRGGSAQGVTGTGKTGRGGGGPGPVQTPPGGAPNEALERTGHTIGFLPMRVSVGCGPPLTAGVGQQIQSRHKPGE